MTAGKIVEQLRRVKSPGYIKHTATGSYSTNTVYENPNGPQAADFIEQQAATITSLTAEVGTVKACLSSMRPRSDDAAYVAGFKAAVDEVRASLFEPIEALAAIQPTDTE
jgi:hypothetical protein